jgi:DNA-binding MarR family transcriptional regulator
VRRARDSLDRRVVNLTLTETGLNVAAQIVEIVPAVLNRRLSDFTSGIRDLMPSPREVAG